MSIYKPGDVWTQADDVLLLKYCSNPRDRCFFAMSRDVAARPHELLKLRIRDIVFKRAQYAEIMVNGKTGNRSLPLYHSIPYIKDWINQHPQSTNGEAILLCSARGKRMHINSLEKIFRVTYKGR
jgi:integrase/recombinase XerD